MSYRLVVILFIFSVLVLGIIVHERTEIFTKNPPPKTGQLEMFTFTEQDLGRVEIIFRGRTSVLAKDSEGNWFVLDDRHSHDGEHSHSAEELVGHDHGESDRSSEIKEQIEITTRMIADRKLKVSKVKSFSDSVACIEDTVHSHTTEIRDDCVAIASWGLENPATVFGFYPTEQEGVNSTQPLGMLYVGDMLPSQYTYYTKKDGDNDVYLVPRYFIAMLLATAFGPDEVPSMRPEK